MDTGKLSADDLRTVWYARRHLAPDWRFVATTHSMAWVSKQRTGIVLDFYHGEIRLTLPGRRKLTFTARGERQWTATEIVAIATTYGMFEQH